MKAIIAAALFISLLATLTGCGTTGGAAFADFLQSPVGARIIDVAANAGAASLLASTGQDLTPEAREALHSATSPLISTVGTGVVWAIGDALRGKQGTRAAANAPVLAATLATNAAAPATVAWPVAEAVRALTSAGVPPSVANEAVAVAVQAVAAQRDRRL